MDSKLRNAIRVLFSLPKTIYFNFRFFPMKLAIHFPVFIHWKTKICEMHRGAIVVEKVKPGIVRIGFPAKNFDAKTTRLCVSGTLVFKGKAVIGNGCELVIRGSLAVGDHLIISDETKVDAKAESILGDNVLIGHKCVLIDDDGHKIFVNGERTNEKIGYYIGNHVWLSRECLVLKGSYIGDNVVVGARSLISRRYETEHVILAGTPAKIIKEHVDWDY